MASKSNESRGLTGGSTGGSTSRPLTSSTTRPRPPTINGSSTPNTRSDGFGDLTPEQREQLVEEGLAAKGDTYGEKLESLEELEGVEDRRRGKVGSAETEWDALLQSLLNVFIHWRRRWDREILPRLTGQLNGTSSSSRHSLSSPRLNGSNAPSLRALVTHFVTLIPPRRRALIAITSTLLFFILILQPRRSTSLHPASKSLAILTASGIDGAIVDRTTGKHHGVNKAKVLEGFSNPYGFISLIDPYAGGVFNPSVLVLPDSVGLGWRHLLVARGPERYEVIDGEDTRWQSIVGCFLLPLKRPHLDLPYLARESELEELKLPADRKVDYTRCEEAVYDQFIGPEDPRLFFTNDGQPLLVYSQTGRSPNICRAIFIIDARSVIPGLDKAMKKGGWSPPIMFPEQTDLIREDQYNIEKNWAPFLGEKDELFFHVSVVPQEIYKYVPGLTLKKLNPSPPPHNCITEIVGADMNRIKFHHATPLLRVTMCRRGECVPDIHNTVLFGMIHIKYHPLPYLFYERRVITLNVTSPYEYLSVSKPLTYSGTNQADPIFTVSASWDHPTKKNGLGLNHGFLDDVLLVSFGVMDYGSAMIDVLARDLLTDHTLCTGVKGFELW